MNNITRQDMQAVTEGAKNKILERLVTKYDVQSACDGARDRVLSAMQSMHLENQAVIRQLNATRDQGWRKTISLESQVIGLQQEVRTLHQMISRLYEQNAR